MTTTSETFYPRRVKPKPPVCNEPLNCVRFDEPYYNMCTFLGRFKHFLAVTFPPKVLYTETDIEHSSTLVRAHRQNRLRECVSVEDLWHHKYICHSHVHPETDETYHLLTRWPSTIFVNTLLTAGMLTFHRTYAGLAFWQWANQTYQTYINWNHRRINSCASDQQIFNSFVAGTATSIGTAFGLKYLTQRYFPKAPSIGPKLIPLAALFVGNFFAVPVLRAQELRYGVPIYDHLDRRLGTSVLAAQHDVTHDIITRNAMFVLPFVLTPFLMRHFRQDNYYWVCRFPGLRPFIQLALLGPLFALSVPMALALFRCRGEMNYCDLEPGLRYRLQQRFGNAVPYMVFYESEC